MNAEQAEDQHHSDRPGLHTEKPSANEIARGMRVLLGPSLLLGRRNHDLGARGAVADRTASDERLVVLIFRYSW